MRSDRNITKGIEKPQKKPFCLIFAGKSNQYEPLRMSTLKLGRAAALIRLPASKGDAAEVAEVSRKASGGSRAT